MSIFYCYGLSHPLFKAVVATSIMFVLVEFSFDDIVVDVGTVVFDAGLQLDGIFLDVAISYIIHRETNIQISFRRRGNVNAVSNERYVVVLLGIIIPLACADSYT